MKFKIERGVFLEGIRIVLFGIGNPKESLILNNILLELKKNRLFLTSTDSEVNIKTELNVDGEIDGVIIIQAKKLGEIVQQIDDNEIIMEVGSKNKITILTKKSTFSLPGLPADNFPIFPTLPKQKNISISTSLLIEVIKKVIFAVATNNTPHTLSGVCFLFKKNKIITCATNGHRLSVIKKDLQNKTKEYEVIIPIKILKEIPHIFKNGNIVDIIITPKQIGFQDKKTTIISKLIIGKFPDYKLIIPKSKNKEIKLKKREFLDACRRVAVMTSERNNIIKIHPQKNQILINTNSPDIGEAKEKIKTSYKKDEAEMGLNPRYLLDALINIEDEEFIFAFNQTSDPILLKTTDDTQINIIMPIKT